eukprot:TRINITY_DN52128_c0_g2_i1.p1 TRINITY_DN52128_c0_g2~~TRINITY_DN52128_c0_g2_i1.p1  ORF type:complete len:331 (+),score=33.71 TRINITY_DN52128_c0_g2_i1:57-995(+)
MKIMQKQAQLSQQERDAQLNELKKRQNYRERQMAERATVYRSGSSLNTTPSPYAYQQQPQTQPQPQSQPPVQIQEDNEDYPQPASWAPKDADDMLVAGHGQSPMRSAPPTSTTTTGDYDQMYKLELRQLEREREIAREMQLEQYKNNLASPVAGAQVDVPLSEIQQRQPTLQQEASEGEYQNHRRSSTEQQRGRRSSSGTGNVIVRSSSRGSNSSTGGARQPRPPVSASPANIQARSRQYQSGGAVNKQSRPSSGKNRMSEQDYVSPLDRPDPAVKRYSPSKPIEAVMPQLQHKQGRQAMPASRWGWSTPAN